MRKLSEIKNEEALELIADTIEPISNIASDKGLHDLRAKKANKIQIMKYIIANHDNDVMLILAALEGKPIEEFEISALEIPMRVLEILNDKDMINLFTSQGTKTAESSYGSAMENTGAKGS